MHVFDMLLYRASKCVIKVKIMRGNKCNQCDLPTKGSQVQRFERFRGYKLPQKT